MKNKENKKTKEFSKIIITVLAIVSIAQLIIANILMFITSDLTPLVYIIPSIQAILGLGVSFYYKKAETENKIKLMKDNGIEPTKEDLYNEQNSYNEGVF